MITKEYLQQELAKRIDGYRRGVATTTDNTILEMKSILVLVDALQDRVKDYDDMVKRVKELHDAGNALTKQQMEIILPELRESEDEEIRQQLLWLCGQWEHNPEGRTIPADISNIRKIRNWLDWKPTETDTALFNKAVTTNKALTPTERAQLDIIRSKFGYCGAVNCSGIVQKEQNPTQSNIEKEYIRTIKSLIADFLRGKCDIDARYYQKIYDWLDGRHIESKPIEWNEEDENIRKQLISICDEWLNGGYNARPCLDDVRWLKNLLENQKEPTTVEWNEEDKDYYDTIVRKLEVIGDDSGLSSNQIKFLREHCPLHRSEWSEEDEKKILFLERLIKYHVPEGRYGYIDKSVTKLQAITMLKSLRPSWKPSDEQMEGLKFFLEFHRSQRNAGTVNWREYDAIESLYEQLKKL